MVTQQIREINKLTMYNGSLHLYSVVGALLWIPFFIDVYDACELSTNSGNGYGQRISSECGAAGLDLGLQRYWSW